MKRLLILLFCLPFAVIAQDKSLMAEGSSPSLYLNHTVGPKENYYSIGRIYNISPKEIAPFNNLQLENGLSLGQQIKIPLSASNFIQSDNVKADEATIPVYHIVKEKEGLYRISVTYNKLPVETIKKWNHVTGESVSNGTKLIVGYLKVKKDLSPLAGAAVTPPPVAAQVPKESPKPAIVKEEKPAVKETKVKEEKSAVVQEEKLKEEKAKEEKAAVVKEEKIKEEKIKEAEKTVAVKEEVKTPVKVPEHEKVVIAEPKKEVVKETKPAVESPKEEMPSATAKTFNGGVFKSDFEKQSNAGAVAVENGSAAVFKSTSGWEDGKYYCLHNTAAPGTIVKITNKVTGKAAYAKVLDVIPDIKQNNGLLIRVSNAAAEELGAVEGKFDCVVSYAK